MENLAEKIVNYREEHSGRLSQVEGFGYGKDGLHYVIRDCWLDENQEIWSKQSNIQDQYADHKEMSRQINIYKMKLILKGVDISSEMV